MTDKTTTSELKGAVLHLMERKLIRDVVKTIATLFYDAEPTANSKGKTVHDIIYDLCNLEKTNLWDRNAYIRDCFDLFGIRSSSQNGTLVYRQLSIGDQVKSTGCYKPLKRRRVKN